jgi:hypothetical protein
LQKLATIAVLVAVAGVLCGFNGTNFTYDLNAYRGEPVGDAIARLGRPVRRGHIDGRRIYYWYTTSQGRDVACKIWGTARGGVITNWGYRDCAF